MKKIIAAVLVVATMSSLLLAGCGPKKTSDGQDNSWDKVKKNGEFVLGFDEEFPPMGFKDENGKYTGFDIDLATEVCSRLGVKLKPQPINWDAKEQELNTGSIDCIWNGFTITDDRKKNILFSEPYMDNRQVLVVMDNSKFSKLSDLEGKILSLQAGSSAALALDGAADFKSKLKKVIELKDNMTALMDLEKGGSDAVLMDEIVARYYIQMKGKKYKVIDDALATEEYGVGFRKNDSQLKQKIQETLEAMAKDGKLAEISNKWFGKDITTIAK